MKIIKCKKCGRYAENRFKGYCENCYNYYRKGGTDNPLPPKGVIAYDTRNYPICHICGQAFKKLGQHTWNKHLITSKEYKQMFGLCNNSHLTEKQYAQKMSDYAYQNNMPKQLKTVGINTRIKPGEKRMRLGKKARLQECLAKQNRTKGAKNEFK